MSSLLRKELSSIKPIFLLVLFFGSLDWLFILTTEFPDQYPLASYFVEEEDGWSLIPYFIVAFALAAGLLVRERDEGTLDFLDALPVNRIRIFLAKYTVALGVLLLLPFASLLAALTFQCLSLDSINSRFHWDVLGGTLLIECCMCFVYLSIGLALSFLRKFSYLALVLFAWVYVLCRELGVPYVALFNPFTAGEAVFEGSRLVIPVQQLLIQLAIGLAGLALALGGFVSMGDHTARMAEALNRRRGVAWLKMAGMLAIASLWLGFFVYWSDQEESSQPEDEVVYQEWGTVRATTQQYVFVYPEYQARQAEDLIARADAVHDRVQQFLGTAPAGNIAVDLTSALPRHAGLAYWKRIRMKLVPGMDLETLEAILAHETAHIYIDKLSDSRLHAQFDSTRFFHEGLATYIEHHLFLGAEKLQSLRRVAAVMRAREQVEFEELLDDQLFSGKWDRDLVYPLGEVFVYALVERYGEESPARVTQAFGRKGAPEGLKGVILWQDVLQACGYNLSEVVDGFYAELDKAVDEHRWFIERIPRLRGAVEYARQQVGIRPSPSTTAAGEIVCRFRARAAEADRFYEWSYPDESGIFWAPASGYSGRSFWYQLGLSTPDAAHILFEEWEEVPLTKR